jgi:hypothetical protein
VLEVRGRIGESLRHWNLVLSNNVLVTTTAKLQIRGLVAHQQGTASAGMGLMATQTSHVLDFGGVQRIRSIRYRMAHYRMALAVLQGKTNDLREVVLWQPNRAVENSHLVIALDFRGLGVGTVTFKAERIALSPE